MTEGTQYIKEKELLVRSALPLGTVLHNGRREYKIVKVLGAGGFGITYKVSSIIMVDNVPITTYFAIKEYFLKGCYRDGNSTALQCSPTMRSEVNAGRNDFLNEAKRLNKLSGKSRNIVRVNEAFEENGTAYYVMEYLDGGDLRRLAEGRGLPEGQAVSLILPVAEAVSMLHEAHILHLDIKPENIVIKTNETDGSTYPVLIDFGIAKHFDDKGRPTSHLLAKGASDGYAPIEQYTEITAFSPQIDVYAIGATLLFLLTGKRPMKSFDVTPAIVETCLPENVSAKTRQAVKSAMSRFKEERTPDVRSFISSIKNTYTLPLGYLLKGKHACYRITEILGERNNCIIYKAIQSSLSLSNPVDRVKGGKPTKAIVVYEIFEFFDCKANIRNDEGHVIVRDGFNQAVVLQVESDAFLKDARIATGLSSAGDCSYDNRQGVNSEIFSANGTLYYVVQGKKKRSSFNETVLGLRKVAGRAWRPLLLLCACAALIYSIILVSDGLGSHKVPAPASSSMDTVSVENVVDSVVGKKILIDSVAVLEKDVTDEGNMQQNNSKVIKEETKKVETPITDKKDKQQKTQSEVRNVSDDEIYAKALASKDWSAMKRLADKGYAKAYLPLANHYLNSPSTHSLADKYAQKAKSKKMRGANKVIEILDAYGYYD